MKRILVVGGGPAGLFFALLAKRSLPTADVVVREQNPSGVTYGWGFGFSQSAIDALRPTAPDIIAQLEGNSAHDVMEIVLNGEVVQIAGDTNHCNPRWALLNVLETAAEAAGVRISHDDMAELDEAELERWSLVVAADGINSRTRERFAGAFEPTVELTENWLAWYGTKKFFNPSIILHDTPDGVVMSHATRFSAEMSNFTIEIGQQTFDALGFASMTEAESVTVCEKLFADYLDGESLVSNHSPWFQAKFVHCARWSYRNLVLIGDALHTVHPSIGAGTRFGMRDAVYLLEGLVANAWDVTAGLDSYESRRKPVADGFQQAARRSIAWYEGLPHRRIDDPVKFALEFFMRTGRIRYPDFREQNKAVIETFETQLR